ncbi:hypothetical protein VCHC48A1_3163, partial [Vibrio cholerae HC-48A1]
MFKIIKSHDLGES